MGLSHERTPGIGCRSQRGSWGECTLPSEPQPNASLASRSACRDATIHAASDCWQPGQRSKTFRLKGVMWCNYSTTRISKHVLKLHAGENINLPLHSRQSAYTVRWVCRSSGLLLFACWPWSWMRKTGCWRRPESECKIAPSWIQSHLWSASSQVASGSSLIPEKEAKYIKIDY